VRPTVLCRENEIARFGGQHVTELMVRLRRWSEWPEPFIRDLGSTARLFAEIQDPWFARTLAATLRTACNAYLRSARHFEDIAVELEILALDAEVDAILEERALQMGVA